MPRFAGGPEGPELYEIADLHEFDGEPWHGKGVLGNMAVIAVQGRSGREIILHEVAGNTEAPADDQAIAGILMGLAPVDEASVKWLRHLEGWEARRGQASEGRGHAPVASDAQINAHINHGAALVTTLYNTELRRLAQLVSGLWVHMAGDHTDAQLGVLAGFAQFTSPYDQNARAVVRGWTKDGSGLTEGFAPEVLGLYRERGI